MLFKQDNKPQISDLSENERIAALRLFRTDNIGPITFNQLIDNFQTPSEALRALPELAKRGGRKKPLCAPSEKETLKEYKALKKLGGQIITYADKQYPLPLSSIDDAPPVISVIGNADLLNKPSIAIVGARNASLNGKKIANKLAAELGTRNQVIVSGLARGIDTAAHKGSLNTGTIAVVAGGIDVIYPEENQDLYNEIAEKGLIIAESALGAKPYAASFPRRNRIVSGISNGVLVVEATLRSGSLITARLAGEQGRDVFAVPGSPFDPRAAGPNHLIREGATLIRNADDIMEILMDFSGNSLRESPSNITGFTHNFDNDNEEKEEYNPEIRQEKILKHLSFSPISVDELLRACHLNISTMQMTLLELELAGRIKRLPANKVILLQEG